MGSGAHGRPWFTEDRARRFGWLFITLAVLVVYWPLSSFHYTTDGGDTFDCWLPWRHFMSLALKNGELPVWNPLQQMGYPVFADLQGPFWYPEAIAIGGTVGHSIWTLQGLFLAYVIVGGIGFMRLCTTVHGDARIGTLTGLAYSLCGFHAAHQMHFYAIISAAWMPWFLAAQIRLLRAPHWRTALEAAVLLMLLLTGGNHTFTIISVYLLLPLFIASAWRLWRQGGAQAVGRLIALQSLFVGCTLLLASGTFYAWLEVSPYLGRAKGLPYALSSEGPANLTTLPTLFFPALFGKNDWSLGTHPAMANAYMGVTMLPLAFIALMRRRTMVENIFAVFGSICLLLSLANDLPFHRFAWRWLPGLNVFRFPSYYLYFTLVAVLLLAAGSLKEAGSWRWGYRRSMILGLGGALIVGTALVLLLPERTPTELGELLRGSLFERVRALSFKERMLAGWLISAPVLLIALLLVWRRKLSMGVLLFLVFLEMSWNTHLCTWNSALSDLHPAALDARLARTPKGPVIPDQLPLALHHDAGEALHHLWRNTQTFLGTPSREGFNSFWPTHTDSLINHHPDLAAEMDKRPVVYLSDHLLPDSLVGRTSPDSGTVFLTTGWDQRCQRSPDDRIAFTGPRYDGFLLRTRTAEPTFLVVQQTWFPGWSIRIDNEAAPVVRANVAAFGTLLPGGDHEVDIRFERPLLPWLMGISMTAFIAALIFLSWPLVGMRKTASLLATASLAGMIGWSLLANGGHRDEVERRKKMDHQLSDAADDTHLYNAPGAVPWQLFKGHDFTPAFSIPADSLMRSSDRTLAVDIAFQPKGRCRGLLVLQRTIQGKTTEYETIRFVSPDSASWARGTFTHAQDLREFRFQREQIGIYLWNQGPDTLVVTDMRIRTSPHAIRNEW